MKTIGYLRVSKDTQDVKNQRLALLEFANNNKLVIDDFFEINISSRKTRKERGIDQILDELSAGDRLIVSELSRLGRSVGQIIQIVDELIKNDILFIAIKENVRIDGHMNIQTKVMVTMFGLFAEIERDLISQRTKEGLAAARSKGKLLGRPPGPGKSKLDGRENEIAGYLAKGVSITAISKIVEVSWPTIDNFIKTRNLLKQAERISEESIK